MNSDTSIQEAISQFIDNLQSVRKLSVHTLKAYLHDLKILEECMNELNLKLHEVQSKHTRSWVSRLHSKGLAPRSIARRLSAWRTFFEWLIQSKSSLLGPLIQVNPLDDIKSPKKGKALPKALSVEHIFVLIAQAEKDSKEELASNINIKNPQWNRRRDHALLELFYSSGLRLSEILGINLYPSTKKVDDELGWIDWDVAEVNVFGKGAKRRVVPIGTKAMEALSIWKEQLLLLNSAENSPLFINEHLQRLSSRTVQARLKALAIRAELPLHVHPHMLRHSFASHLLQSSHDLRAVQEMLGHASIASTQIYTSLDFQHLAQAYDLAHPRAKLEK
ncbi:MAG: tyrosine recombinase XerC [Betaproteobacteria bacterium]|jgi:integrase/recombinase XerC